MIFTYFAATLLAASTSASTILTSKALFLRSEDILIRPYASLPHLSRRQDSLDDPTTNTSTAELTHDGTLNVTTWDTTTNAACMAALSNLLQSSNPSGTCICYNLPSLDAETGVFEADLRLFKVSEPRGAFADIAAEDIMVGLSYSGASVHPVKPDEMANMGMVGNVSTVKKRAEGGPELLQAYMFVGKIDGANMTNTMTMAALEALIMPILTLTAKNTTGATVSTNVSSNEAAFLTGVFSQQVVMSDFSAAQAAVDAQIAGLKNGTVAFVLPGVQLMVFPIGLIITSVWLVLGMAAYGFGTYERLRHAEAYRRRLGMKMNRGKTF
ncbi:hypothetical protein G7046_g3521 [Stylonectria norvegica]|nr:hypothetical protein G7046_g3521 [Stylonectria norvegica]